MKLLLCTAIVASVAVVPGPMAQAVPASSRCLRAGVIHVRTGANAARAVAAARPGATICFAAGVYRLTTPIRPRARQVLIGQHSVLDGSRPLTSFRRVHDGWRVTHQAQQGQRNGTCSAGVACAYPDDVLAGGRPLHRVLHRAQLARGRYWFDYAHDAIIVDVNPANHVLTALVAPAAIAARGPRAGADVAVSGFVIRHFASPAQQGAIVASAPGWQIRDNTVRDNHGAGITAGGHVTIEHNLVERNGQLGIGGTGTDTTVEANTIRHNGFGGYDTGWEAGGAKWAVTNGLVVGHNRVLDNHGPGLWTDIDAEHSTFVGNLVRGNSAAGIFIETSSTTTVVHNTVERNGLAEQAWLWGGGIQLAASHNVAVHGNHLAGNRTGISLIQQDRGTSQRDGTPRTLHDIAIADNVVTMNTGDSGGVTDDGDEAMFTDRTITWRDDTWIGTRRAAFEWNDSYLTAAQWRALGHDTGGQFR